MGATSSKPVRTAPARYVAKQMPRAPRDVEEEFKKAKHTLQGINNNTERVTTTPQPYVETKLGKETTDITDHTAPRYYLNTWMELMDNVREDKLVLSGNLPTQWERDRFEPYTLVRNRIDDEDLDWLLSEGKKLPIEELVQQTKLERDVLEDILATVEQPRRQFRNYQGKLHKTIDDPNTYLADRKKRLEEAREDELLRDIGFSDEELSDDKQYRTNRSRGVKVLDELGASIRTRKRQDRAAHHSDMQMMLEERRLQAIEEGTFDEEVDVSRPEEVGVPKGMLYKARSNAFGKTYRFDEATALDGEEPVKNSMARIARWSDRRNLIPKGPDHFPDAPVYNERLSETEKEAHATMDRNAVLGRTMAMAQGAKGFFDPRKQYEEMLGIMRHQNKDKPEGAELDHPAEEWHRTHRDNYEAPPEPVRTPHKPTGEPVGEAPPPPKSPGFKPPRDE